MTLTTTERALLNALQPGEIVPVRALIDAIWDYCRRPADPALAVRVHVHKLRQKLAGDGELISLYGRGYQFTSPSGWQPRTGQSCASAETSELSNSPSDTDRPEGDIFPDALLMVAPARKPPSARNRLNNLTASMPSMSSLSA